MFLYLVRHGEAVTEDADALRPLSQQGFTDVSEIAAFMNFDEIKVDEIWHSTKLRAKQTAQILAEAIPHKNFVERQGLTPNDPVVNIASEINSIHEDVIIVGHLPFLSKLASFLLAGTENKDLVDFHAGGVICLERWEKGWQILWMMMPEFLAKCIKHK